MDQLTKLLTETKIPVGKTAKAVFDWLNLHAAAFFNTVSSLLDGLIGAILKLLEFPHPLIFTALAEPQVARAPLTTPIIKTLPKERFGEEVVYRTSGDDYLLVEYGRQELDIRLRFRAHALMLWLERAALPGVLELTPGIRSLQIHYDNLRLPRHSLLAHLERAERELIRSDDLRVPARIVHLPLSWDDEATRLAIRKYDELVRKDAPWCPSNIEFIRRINGLESVDQAKEILFSASYLVMGLGDVYLGAPVATPLDPRHRLVTTKYNPARTWTPENAVGIGGAYLCVYGMEGPGGYQFVGRTLQMWNRYRQTAEFSQPWLLRFFDQIRFYEVSAEELVRIRAEFPRGRYPLTIEETEFSLAEYQAQLDANAEAITAAKQRELSLRQSNEALKRFSAIVSHDLQAPLPTKKRLRRLLQRLLAGRRWPASGEDEFFRKAVRRHELFWVRALGE